MKRKKVASWVLLVLSLGGFYLFVIRGIQFYLVPSDSMEPTLMSLDYIAGFRIDPVDLKRFDIVIIESGPFDDFYVKRIIGLPGESIAIRKGTVHINGRTLDEPFAKDLGKEDFGPVKIPKGHFFLMGDNRNNSLDSRRYGPVLFDMLKGKVSFIYSPVSRMGFVN